MQFLFIWADLILIFSIFMRGSGGASTNLFPFGNSMKLLQGRFSLYIRKRFSSSGCLGIETGSREKWSQHQPCLSSRNDWTVLSGTWRDSWDVQGQELDSSILMDQFQLSIFHDSVVKLFRFR